MNTLFGFAGSNEALLLMILYFYVFFHKTSVNGKPFLQLFRCSSMEGSFVLAIRKYCLTIGKCGHVHGISLVHYFFGSRVLLQARKMFTHKKKSIKARATIPL